MFGAYLCATRLWLLCSLAAASSSPAADAQRAGVSDGLEWIPAGRQWGFDDLVFWSGKSAGRRFEEVASGIDTVVSGPHASAAFPEELRPFVAASLTRRKQHDFSDVATGDLGRAWAELDPHVVFVANPHSRMVLDPNREAGSDGPELQLREFFSRLRRQRTGNQTVSFAGVDAVRPITFSGEDVLEEPQESAGSWQGLVAALNVSALLGARSYLAALEEVVTSVLASRSLAGPLSFISLHDTSNQQMRRDGAIVIARGAAGCMPSLVNFGNLGSVTGEEAGEGVSTTAAELRRVASAWAKAFEVAEDFAQPGASADSKSISLNWPYKGNTEIRRWRARLRKMGARNCNIFQAEFERAALLGPRVAAELRLPGTSWPTTDHAHVASVAQRLKAAGDELRSQAPKIAL